MIRDKKKILICGGSGFIGYNLTKACLKLGWDITSISRHKPEKNKLFSRVKYKILDLRVRKNLSQLNNQYDYVVNVAGEINNNDKKNYTNNHFKIVKNLFFHFKNKNIKAFLNMGSSAEYGDSKSPQKENFKCFPKSLYGKDQLRSTKFLLKSYKKSKFPSIILRLYQAYGPYQGNNRLIPIIAEACYQNKNFNCSDGNQKKDFIFIEDLINLIIKCIKNKNLVGNIYNVGSGKPISIKKIINYIKKYFNGGNPLFGTIKLRKDEKKLIYPDISKIIKCAKWRPKISFQRGLNRTLGFYQKRYIKYQTYEKKT